MLKYIFLTKSGTCPYKKAYTKFLGIKLLGQSISEFFRFNGNYQHYLSFRMVASVYTLIPSMHIYKTFIYLYLITTEIVFFFSSLII